jgi:hypothetical protein
MKHMKTKSGVPEGRLWARIPQPAATLRNNPFAPKRESMADYRARLLGLDKPKPEPEAPK